MIGILKTKIQNKDNDFFAIMGLNKIFETPITSCLFCNAVDDSFILPIKTNILHRSNAYSFDGIIITDDLLCAQDLLHTTYAKKRYIYLYHLEWPYIPNLEFRHIKQILLNDNIDLIARSEHHANLIERLFKSPKYIMPEWDYKTLMEIDKNE